MCMQKVDHDECHNDSKSCERQDWQNNIFEKIFHTPSCGIALGMYESMPEFAEMCKGSRKSVVP